MTSVAKSLSGKHTRWPWSNSFIFNEGHGQEPALIHEGLGLQYAPPGGSTKLKAGEVYSFSVWCHRLLRQSTFRDPLNEAERLAICEIGRQPTTDAAS